MAITFVSAASAAATSLTMPTHAAGDLLLFFAYNSAASTNPTLPSGKTSIATRNAGGSSGMRTAYMVATSSAEVSGTWTNATSLAVAVYRPSSGKAIFPGSSGTQASYNNFLTYPTITFNEKKTTAVSWAVQMGAQNGTGSAVATPPTGCTNRTSATGAAEKIAISDTNGAVTGWTSANSGSGTSNTYQAVVIEVREGSIITATQPSDGRKVVFLPSGSTWTPPSDCPETFQVETYAIGGDGDIYSNGGGGGGSGGYSSKTRDWSPLLSGGSYSLGFGAVGAATWFGANSSSGVAAIGATNASGATGGVGGPLTGAYGDITYPGADGASGSGNGSGSGAGAAGPSGPGGKGGPGTGGMGFQGGGSDGGNDAAWGGWSSSGPPQTANDTSATAGSGNGAGSQQSVTTGLNGAQHDVAWETTGNTAGGPGGGGGGSQTGSIGNGGNGGGWGAGGGGGRGTAGTHSPAQIVITYYPVSGTTYSVSASESASASDTPSSSATLPSAVTEAGAGADTPSSLATFPSAISEAGSAADAPSSKAVFPSTITEAGTAADSPSAASTLPSAVTEAGTAVDAPSSLATLPSAVVESWVATDTVSNGSIYAPSITEAASATDATSSVALHPASVAESASPVDTTSSAAIKPATVSETASATDIASSVGTLPASAVESATPTDTYSNGAIYPEAVVEAGSADDTVSASSIFISDVTDALTAIDAVGSTSGHIYAVAISEAGDAQDIYAETPPPSPPFGDRLAYVASITTTAYVLPQEFMAVVSGGN